MQTVDTVRGPLPLRDLGVTLMHEHILAKCKEEQHPLAVDYAVSELMRARRAGVNTIVEVTPPPLRNFDVIRKVAGNHVPLNEVERKLFLVTGKVQKMTGLPVCCHTCAGARPQFDTLREGGAEPTKLYFSHVGDNYYEPGWEGRTLLEQTDYFLKVAEEGGSLLFNNWSMEAHTPVFHMAFLIKELVRAGFARRVFLSEDHAYEFDEHGRVLIEHANEYDPKKPETWGVRERLGYDHVFVATIPSLIGLGLRPDVIDTFMIGNPRAIFTRSE